MECYCNGINGRCGYSYDSEEKKNVQHVVELKETQVEDQSQIHGEKY